MNECECEYFRSASLPYGGDVAVGIERDFIRLHRREVQHDRFSGFDVDGAASFACAGGYFHDGIEAVGLTRLQLFDIEFDFAVGVGPFGFYLHVTRAEHPLREPLFEVFSAGIGHALPEVVCFNRSVSEAS